MLITAAEIFVLRVRRGWFVDRYQVGVELFLVL